MSNENLELLFAYAVGFISAIICIVPGFPVNRGYQPIRRERKEESIKLPQKSGVQRLCRSGH